GVRRDDRGGGDRGAARGELDEVGLLEIPAHEIGCVEGSRRIESIQPPTVLVERLMIVPARADDDGARAGEGLERPVPRRVLDAESSPRERVGQRAVARAQLRPGAAGGEDDSQAITQLSLVSSRSWSWRDCR